MKSYNKLLIVIFTFLLGIQLSAQRIGDLNGINYQAIAIDEEGKEIVGMDIDGKPLYEKEIGVRFTIQKGQQGEVQYQETHTTLTDQYGLFSLVIGHGVQTGTGIYSDLLSIPWIDADQWLKVEISIENDANYKVVSHQQLMTVPYAFYTDDIADDAITTEKILDQTILNDDISNNTIDLSTKVTDTLAVENGGTGKGSLTDGGLIIGGGTGPVKVLPQASDGQIPVGVTSSDPALKMLAAGEGILITQKTDSVIVSSTISGEVTANGVQSINIGVIPAGSTYISPSFPVPGGGAVMGDIILASLDINLQGCIMTPYLFSENTARVAIFNGTAGSVNLGNNVNVKILIVK